MLNDLGIQFASEFDVFELLGQGDFVDDEPLGV